MSGEEGFQIVVSQKSVTRQQVSDLLCSAWEGGSNYWATCSGVIEPTSWDFPSEPGHHYSFDYPLNPGGAAIIICDDDDNEVQYRLDWDTLQRGLNLLAEKEPTRLVSLLDDTTDAEDGDVFLQLCLFGDIIYG